MSKIVAIPTAIIANVEPSDRTPRQVGVEFRRLLEAGHRLRAYGQAKSDPEAMLKRYAPRFAVDLFGARIFLTNLRSAHDLKLMPAFVMLPPSPGKTRPDIHARVFYKDSSLVWRAASHYINTPDEQWIGKGAVKWVNKNGVQGWSSDEDTTNLPFELQYALDEISRRSPKARHDEDILFLLLRNAPSDRLRPYHDFEAPRRQAMRHSVNRINNNKPVAWFRNDNDPSTLKFEPGFEPDFRKVIDSSNSYSLAYGGAIRKYRIASRNRRIQFLFVHGKQHTWVVHPQALTTELSSYGCRTVDVVADEDLSIPGYDFFDNDGSGEVENQIPVDYAGGVCPFDPDRADASPWNDRLPIIRAFRRTRLARI